MIMHNENQISSEKPIPDDYYTYSQSTKDNFNSSISVPGSRRNSNDKASLFNSSMIHPEPIDILLMKQPPFRSFSMDIGSIQQTSNYVTNLFLEENNSGSFGSTINLRNHSQPSLKQYFSSNSSYNLFGSPGLENSPETNIHPIKLADSLANWSPFSDKPLYSQPTHSSHVPLRNHFSHSWLTTLDPPIDSTRPSNDPALYDPFYPSTHFRQPGYCPLKNLHPSDPPTYHYPSSSSTTTTTSTSPTSTIFVLPSKPQLPKLETDEHYKGVSLESLKGSLYDICKDQHGCRFLQTQLHQGIDMIYEEIHLHCVDLMIDPFGNYLCQKLIEQCSDLQKSTIVEVISPDLYKICKSMHGTRAVQKLIECLSTPSQIKAVTKALEPHVVALVRDLNGNHVIQKCLNQLSSDQNQFIYNIVSEHCIQVASHKHGCCVYQRCIDFATKSQKAQLVNGVIKNALPLVQDPYGNYVVQYVLGLNDPVYCKGLIHKFIEPVRELSIQKFSSNVIEKCIRVADNETKRKLISGITSHPQMENFLHDSYANYVIQTCLDCADDSQRQEFVECIRPFLPSIRNTPYGKRIYSKINQKHTHHRKEYFLI